MLLNVLLFYVFQLKFHYITFLFPFLPPALPLTSHATPHINSLFFFYYYCDITYYNFKDVLS